MRISVRFRVANKLKLRLLFTAGIRCTRQLKLDALLSAFEFFSPFDFGLDLAPS